MIRSYMRSIHTYISLLRYTRDVYVALAGYAYIQMHACDLWINA